jgi:hypothetical protein
MKPECLSMLADPIDKILNVTRAARELDPVLESVNR